MSDQEPFRENTSQMAADKMSRPSQQARRDLLWIMGGFVAFVVVSFGLLMALSPKNAAPDLSRAARTLSGDAIPVAIVHSNDTWGYTEPCG